MDDNAKRQYVMADGWTLEGVRCSVAGWRNDYATVSPACGGSWRASWDTVERVYNSGRNFTVTDVVFSSAAWLGDGTPIPDALKPALFGL